MSHEARGPVGGVDYPRTFTEFRAWFPDDESCTSYLEKLHWPDGFSCPACGGDRGWRIRTGHMMCSGCAKKTSVTSGTIFHRSHTPISTWFSAMWFITSQKNGVSALNLQQQLGFGSCETAWAWLHKLRRAMVRPDRDLLAGVVEVDETFVGGRSHGHSGGSTHKLPIMVAVERVDHRRLGRVRFGIANAPNSSQLVDFACATVAPGSLIRTDGTRTLRRLATMGYTHEYVNGYSMNDQSEQLPGVHLIASLLKRWISGTLHHHISDKHMAYYLDEYAFRFNRRASSARGMLFYRLIQQALATDPQPLAELTAHPE